MQPVKMRRDESTNYKFDDNGDHLSNEPSALPEDLIVVLFNKLGFEYGSKVSLINKHYNSVFNVKYLSLNPNNFICMELFRFTLLKVEIEDNLVNYFRTMLNLIKFNPKRFLISSVLKTVQLFKSRPDDLPICLNIFSEILNKCSARGLNTHLLLEGLRKEGCIETDLATAYVRNGDMNTAKAIVSKLPRQNRAIDEICLITLTQNPDQITTIINQINPDTLKRFSYSHMRKLSLALSPAQMNLALQLIREKIFLSDGLVHGYIISENWDSALQGLQSGWQDESFTRSELWKNNPYLHFIRACQLKKNNQRLLEITGLLERKKNDVNQETPIGVSLTLLRAYLKMDMLQEAEDVKNRLNDQDRLKGLQIILNKDLKKIAKEILRLDRSKIEEIHETVKLDIEDVGSVRFWVKIDPNYFLKCCREKNLSSLEISNLLKKLG